MFKDIGNYISNKNLDFLNTSDLIIGWNTNGDIQFNGNEKLALLFSRLAYVFDIINDEIKTNPYYEDFLDILNGVRIKKTLQNNNLTLPEIADLLSNINEKQVSFIIDEDDEDIIQALISFGMLIGLDKIGLYFTNKDIDYQCELLN